jgi:hypothetical protein
MWSPGLSRAPTYREQLREMTLDQIFTAELELRDEKDLSKCFAESFRIDDVSALPGRRLGSTIETCANILDSERDR